MSSSAIEQDALPGISVVIPAYNYREYVSDAIDSSLAQDYPHVEVVVVNDGSTDDTEAICKRYGDKITYVYKENAGLSAARNTGISVAKYDYVAFMDADDAYCPGALRTLMEKLQELGPEFVLVAARGIRILPDGSDFGNVVNDRTDGRELTAQDFYLRNRFAPSSSLVRKDVFAKVGDFETSLKSSEDRDMWLRVATIGRVYRIHRKLVRIRRHGKNMSGNAVRMCSTKLKILERARKLGVCKPEDKQLHRKAMAMFHFEAAQVHSPSRNYGKFIWDMLLSFYYWPWFADPMEEVDSERFFRLHTAIQCLRTYPSPDELMQQKYGDKPVPTPGYLATHGSQSG